MERWCWHLRLVVTSGSVYTPGSEVVATPAGGLPVVVWIHGGGYIQGSANLYNGADLILDSNYGVITVVIQYRLGLFGMSLLFPLGFKYILRCIHYRLGFLSGEAVKEGGAPNAGLRTRLSWSDSHSDSAELNILSRSELCVTVGAGPRKQSFLLAWRTPADRKLTWIDKQLRRWPHKGYDLGTVRWWAALSALCHHRFCLLLCSGGGSVLQHLVAHGGNTQPPLFRFAMTSSMMLPSQYNYNDWIPEVILVDKADVHRVLNSATRCCIVRLSMEQSKFFQSYMQLFPI
jgi:hypothetical protein